MYWRLLDVRFLFGDGFFFATEDFREATLFRATFLFGAALATAFRFLRLFLFGMLGVYLELNTYWSP